MFNLLNFNFFIIFLKITDNEATAAVNGFQQIESLTGTGLKFEEEKYFVLQADNERIIGKKTSNGFFIYKTKQGFFFYS